MKSLNKLVWLLPLWAWLALAAQGGQHNLRFVDESGRPVADVIVRGGYNVFGLRNTFEIKSDADGRISIAHPCGNSMGSCCNVSSGVNYQVVGKIGYNFSGAGVVGCLGSSQVNTTFTSSGQEYPKLMAVSAATYREPLSSEMITAAFGTNLASVTAVAELPLPTLLGGRRVFVRNSDGVEQAAPLLSVSPTQINFIMPPTNQNEAGLRSVIVRDENNQVVSLGIPRIRLLAPGIFTANADGNGVPAAVIVRAQADGAQQYEPVAQFDPAQNRFVPLEIDLGTEAETIVLALFGTGWRYYPSTLLYVEVKIGGVNCPVEYLGRQPIIEGLDQLNVRLPRSLIGKGDVPVEVRVGDLPANVVQLKIK